MKVCVTALGAGLDAQVDSRFGRCACFVCVDTETMDCEAIPNDSANASGGAGISAAKVVIDTGAQAVLTGNCGPNAFRTLAAGGVAVYTGMSGTVQAAVEQFKSGKLTPDQDASVDSHSGTGA